MKVENNKVIMALSEMLAMYRNYDGKRPPRPCNQCVYHLDGKCTIHKGCVSRVGEIGE